MQPMFTRLTALSAAAMLLAGVAGCSDPGPANLAYPPLPTTRTLENKVLTKQEQDDAIRKLKTAKDTHSEEAMSEIEWRTLTEDKKR